MRIPLNLANSVRDRARKLRYLPACILAGLMVYPFSLAFALPLMALLYALSETAFPLVPNLSDSAYRTVAVSLAFASSGFVIGLLQKSLIKRYFSVNLARWRLVSIIGACVAGWIILNTYENRDCLIVMMRSPLGDRYYDYYPFMLSLFYTPVIQFAFVLSAMHTLYLYRYVRSAWLWLVANVAAGALFFWVFVYAFVDTSFMSWLVAAIVQAMLVGYAMRYLMTQRRRGRKAKRDDASIT